MKTYREFCLRYDLDESAPDSKIQYQQYREAYDTLIAITGEMQ